MISIVFLGFPRGWARRRRHLSRRRTLRVVLMAAVRGSRFVGVVVVQQQAFGRVAGSRGSSPTTKAWMVGEESRGRLTVALAAVAAAAAGQLLLFRLAVVCTESPRLAWVLALWSCPKWKALYSVVAAVLVVVTSQPEVDMAPAPAQ